MNVEAKKYYGITELAYRYLDIKDTPFMNLGLWPASSLMTAQAQLVESLIEFFGKFNVTPKSILELGPGWGGSRKLLYQNFPDSKYIGLNLSESQIAYASLLNNKIPNTEYISGYFETDIPDYSNPKSYAPNTVFAVESIIHVEDKIALWKQLKRKGFDYLLIADICGDGKSLVADEPLFYPSLMHIKPVRYYTEYFTSHTKQFYSRNDSARVFQPWSDAVNRIDKNNFKGSKKILTQFKKSYCRLAALAACEKIQYFLFAVEL